MQKIVVLDFPAIVEDPSSKSLRVQLKGLEEFEAEVFNFFEAGIEKSFGAKNLNFSSQVEEEQELVLNSLTFSSMESIRLIQRLKDLIENPGALFRQIDVKVLDGYQPCYMMYSFK